MKVICINNDYFAGRLTIGKTYKAEDIGIYYKISPCDAGGWIYASKDMFVSESVKQVICIDNGYFESQLTVGKVYDISDDRDLGDEYYNITENDLGEKNISYSSERFLPARDVKMTKKGPLTETKTSIPEWKVFRGKLPDNECPCGSTRGVCQYHS
jgi:hypothetical protein